MTCTTASGLLPAGIAVYVQRGPNGDFYSTTYPVGETCASARWDLLTALSQNVKKRNRGGLN